MVLALVVILAVLLAAAYGWARIFGQAATPASLALVAALGLTAYALFVLAVLAGFRRVVRLKEQQASTRGRIPAVWRVTLLWPYRRRDIDRMAAEGRLAELMTLSFILVTLAGLSIAVALPPLPARAAESAMTELLLKPRSSPAQIEQSTTRQVETNADPALSFSLLVPRDWLKFEPYKPENPDGKGLVLLSRYGSRDQKALVEVYALKLERELSSADWLDVWLRENGYSVLDRHVAYSPAGWNADVLAARRVNGTDFIYRMSTFKNADRLYLVFGFAQQGAYPIAEEAFVVAANSFRLANGADTPSAEPLRTIRLSRALPARFVFPASWEEARDESAGPEQESLNLKNVAAGRTIGQLNVLVAPAAAYASHGALADVLTAAVKAAVGADLPHLLLKPVDLGTALTDAREGEAEVQTQGSTIRIRATIARGGTSWVSFLLVSFKPTPDPYLIDAINRRAYDIAVRTFGPSA